MALELTINGKVLTAKPSFGFARTADEKYGTYVERLKKFKSGVNNILSGIVEGELEALVQFFDCAFAHLGKDRPKIEDIEAALEARIDETGDIEELYTEVYTAFATAGFFKKVYKEFWKNVAMMTEMGETEAEKKQNATATEYMMKKKAELEAHLTMGN